MSSATKKTVLITGSTRSIGLALVEYYIKNGWDVIGTARANSNTDGLVALSPSQIVTLDSDTFSTRTLFSFELNAIVSLRSGWIGDR
ncbi:Short chain dehydrogenase [Phytophthora cinnamomi]|uniref:Short chain dehydrogenase n=1 Tax=Phytophthora cinnamomi TaxID=4785 RepID=UPI00355ABDA6|nr:Short chain dehydrogenase [Phytophthora cinnamomi]